MISGCTCLCYSVVFFEEKSPSSFISAPLHIIRWCTALASVQQMPLNRSLKQALLKWQPVAWLCGSLSAVCASSLSIKNHNTNTNYRRSYLWQPRTAILLTASDNKRKGRSHAGSRPEPSSRRAREQLQGITSRTELLGNTHIQQQHLWLSVLSRQPSERPCFVCYTVSEEVETLCGPSL